MSKRRAVAPGAALLLCAGLTGCTEQEAQIRTGRSQEVRAEPGWVDLLSRDHWRSWQPVRGYEQAQKWTLEGGVFRGTNSWVYYDRPIGDFILQLEFKYSGDGQGGIALRSPKDSRKPWSDGVELDIDALAGGEFGHVNFPGLRPYPGSARFEVGKWHRVRIEADGGSVRVRLNGAPVLHAESVEPRKGYLMLEGHTGGPAYRNLRIRPLRPDRSGAPSRTPTTRPAEAARHAPAAWVRLIQPEALGPIRTVRGSAKASDRGVLLNADGAEQSTVVVKDVNFADGEVELEVARRGGVRPSGPYTIALRVPLRLNWTAVYFVCRPDRLEVCRGSAWRKHPKPELRVKYLPAKGDERWRFLLAGERIDAYRNGRHVASYEDDKPVSGSIAISADGCRALIRAARYRPAASAD